MNHTIARLYLLMLAAHVAHIMEELAGHFWLMNVYGDTLFLILNWLLFCIPVGIYYLILLGHRRGYQLGIVYAVLMILNGIGHNLATIMTGRYYGGFAGGISGIALLAAGIPLLYSLWRELSARYKTLGAG